MRFPVSLSPHRRGLLVVVLGTVLVFTAVFAPMGAIVPTYRYEVVEVSPDSKWAEHITYSDDVLTCVDDDPECQTVSQVRADGPRVVDSERANCAEMPAFCLYQVAYYPRDDAFYRLHHESLGNDSVELRVEAISNRTAMDIAALEAETFPQEFERLFESGTVRTSDPIAGWEYWQETHELVEYEGQFYTPGGWAYNGPNRHWDEYVRGATALAGIGLLLYGRTLQIRAGTRDT
ncbi:hypothetical protein GJR96_06570 [Haloferax sp. MBLA0076]|uniref:Uncharacterized protein n=1 Tax=Haloferax litoreum TaxID=2666140 RepID=A0A6A8GEP9_9EURY|nr:MULTISPECIES: hypothetical protein [Haloferax]KAB1193123.1 hypothetical protein Hfx1148_06560 [Haloferax sp. CBA1148]MRX21618.1 hypothetical protein [Haloferax litoreum]